jgi:hypothetical protein
MTYEFALPTDQRAVLNAFVGVGRLHGLPSPLPTWSGHRVIRPGDRCPVLRQGNGTVWLQEAVWGRRTAESKELTAKVCPFGLQSAWPCLVPMSWRGQSGDAKQWALIAGFWAPADRHNPESFRVLTRVSDLASNTPASHKVLAIDRQHWLDWVDPQKTNSLLYQKAWMGGFIVEAADLENQGRQA